MSLFGKAITKGNGFEFDPNGVPDVDYRTRLEHKRRQHRAELVDRGGIIAIHHHISAPVTHSNDEQFDLEVGLRLPG